MLDPKYTPNDVVVLTENQFLPGVLRTIDVDDVSHSCLLLMRGPKEMVSGCGDRQGDKHRHGLSHGEYWQRSIVAQSPLTRWHLHQQWAQGQRKDIRVGGVLDRVDDQFVNQNVANPVFRIDNCAILN